ncbi:MAG: thioredoxin family protein [Pseudomonadota bacterium]|nr:thioredoxin family protein [Pseudomonadota bacterium]
MRALRSLVLGLWLLPLALAAEAAELVMFTDPGCPWCAAFEREIGPIYPKTEEGRRAPLRRIDIHDRPQDLAWIEGVRMTPTFVLIEGDREVGRITGYPGADFFFGLLGTLLGKLDQPRAWRDPHGPSRSADRTRAVSQLRIAC